MCLFVPSWYQKVSQTPKRVGKYGQKTSDPLQYFFESIVASKEFLCGNVSLLNFLGVCNIQSTTFVLPFESFCDAHDDPLIVSGDGGP